MRFAGAEEARKAIEAYTSPRTRYLDELERYVEGTQYIGLRSWDDGETPLRERAPCIVYLLAKAAIESNEDLLLGDHRFPELSTKPGEDDDIFDEDDDEGLNEDDSAYVDRVICEVERVAKFAAACREAFASAQAVGTSVVICGARGTLGRLFIDTVSPKWCERELDSDGRVTKLIIQYPYENTFRDSHGEWRVRAMLYRREIDALSDTTMLPVEVVAETQKINWKPDPAQTFPHGLGFCPVLWHAHMQGCATVEQIDGKAIHRACLDEIRELDYSLSQRHSAALYTGAPQLVEIGVAPGYNPTDVGRTAIVPGTPTGGALTSGNKPSSEYRTMGAQVARKKGVSVAWQYNQDAKDVRVEYLTLDGAATKVLDDDAHDIRQKLAEMMCVVFMDPDNIKFAATLSGKAIEILLGRQLNRVDKYRDDFGDGLMVPMMAMMLRIVCRLTFLGRQVALRGRKKLVAILGDGGSSWNDPMIFPKWGPYFKPNAEDQAKVIDATIKAKTEGLITLETAVERISSIFSIENVHEYVESLVAEIEDAQAKAMGMMQAQKDAMGDHGESDDAKGAEGENPEAPKAEVPKPKGPAFPPKAK